MMAGITQRITPFLWYNSNAEEAVNTYVDIFNNSRVLSRTRYTKESAQASGQPAGSIMTIVFQLEGQEFTAINGGPIFTFSPSISFVIHCRTQAEIDHYWDQLAQGGDARAQQCGWLADRFGVSWQVVPEQLMEWMGDAEKGGRVMAALLPMKKLDLATLERAAEG
jgi:predicted 3-demethylubiquinone-9 3-methyltransferase (glyoxalase superfamily)